MSKIQELKNEIEKLNAENKKMLNIITNLENELYKSAYYKEGHYAIELVKKNRELEAKEKEIQELKSENNLSKIIEEKNKEIQNLINEIQELKSENNRLKNNKVVSDKKIHNERGAGRKSRFTEHDKEVIRMYRLQGKTIKEIAEMFSCSIGLIHKIINENKDV